MIDLQSDTVTRPDQAMRDAARDATVGDDIYGGDPTATELERRAANLVGMEDALFVPSGTMGNQIAIRVHTEPGNEILVEANSHVYMLEGAGAAQLSGVQSRAIHADDWAIPSPEQIDDAFVGESLHRPETGLLILENTHNYYGGIAVPKERMDAAAESARDLGVPVHVDGARIFNAAVALDTPAAELLETADTVMFCLSKGLAAPVGSILAGPATFIEEARKIRKLFGGAMRQVGVIAAPGLLALENVDCLERDHEKATRLAAGLKDVHGLSVADPVTNIVIVDSERSGLRAERLVDRSKSAGVLGGTTGEYTTRFCTHRDVTSEDIDTAIDRIRTVVDS